MARPESLLLWAWLALLLLCCASRAQRQPYQGGFEFGGFAQPGYRHNEQDYNQLISQIFQVPAGPPATPPRPGLTAASKLQQQAQFAVPVPLATLRPPTFANNEVPIPHYLYDYYDRGAAFAHSLFQDLARFSSGNIVVSPFSAYVALLMTSFGAAGRTDAEMAVVLRRPQMIRALEPHFPRILDELQALPGAVLRIANGIFVSNVNLTARFSEELVRKFRALILPVDLRDRAQAARTINEWVSRSTSRLIPEIVNENDIKNERGLHILNAVYFKGRWLHPFNPSDTSEQLFFYEDGSEGFVPTMFQRRELRLGSLDDLDAQFVVLPYTRDQRLNMLIVVPNDRYGLRRLEAGLAELRVADLVRRDADFPEPELELFLPRFKIETTKVLTNSLWRMGMRDMFLSAANFSGISETPLKVGTVVQKAFIEVTEEGTEAAVVTDAEGIELLMLKPQTSFLRVDRPSLFFIAYDDIVLFAGRLAEPTRTP